MPEQTITRSTAIPGMQYRNASEAIEWLCSVFGFEKHAVYAGPGNTIMHAELTLGGGMVMLGSINDKAPERRDVRPLGAKVATGRQFRTLRGQGRELGAVPITAYLFSSGWGGMLSVSGWSLAASKVPTGMTTKTRAGQKSIKPPTKTMRVVIPRMR